jgi:hypothetical protein
MARDGFRTLNAIQTPYIIALELSPSQNSPIDSGEEAIN